MEPRPIRRAAGAAALVLAIALAFALAYRLSGALCAALGGIVLGNALAPIVDRLVARGLSPRWAGALVFGGLIIAGAATMPFAIPAAAAQLSGLLGSLPSLADKLQARLQTSSLSPLRHLGTWTSPLAGTVATAPAIAKAADLLGRTLRTGYELLLLVVMAAAWSEARERARTFVATLESTPRRASLYAFAAQAEEKIGTYARGQLIVCASSATVAVIAYLVFGLPFSLVLGLATGLAEIVPILGPITAGLAVLLFTLAARPERLVWVAAALLCNHLFQSYVVLPRVMNRVVGISPIAVLLALSVFGALFGVAGAALAVPIAALIQIAFDRYVALPDEGGEAVLP